MQKKAAFLCEETGPQREEWLVLVDVSDMITQCHIVGNLCNHNHGAEKGNKSMILTILLAY